MDRNEALTKTELEVLLQIAETQRLTVLVLDQAMRFLGELMTKPAISEADREARFQAISKEMLNRMDATEKRCIASAQREIDTILGKQRYWESAVGNLQAEVSALIRKAGQDRDTEAIDGIFKG